MLTSFRRFKLFGSRTIKTGIAVFLTALICELLDFPVIFAVITSIVTIEHTAADSIRKAFIRFPASAIGALLAASFYGLFGHSAVTYALAAVFTIAICHKLHLQDGIIVATLTAVAMIPEFHMHYFVSFFVRLGTTSIGIVVSSLVNFFLLPPNYTTSVYLNIKNLYKSTAKLLEDTSAYIENVKPRKKQMLQISYRQLLLQVDRINHLIQYQRDEWRYHIPAKQDIKKFHYAQKKLNMIQQIVYHIGNLHYAQINETSFNEQEKLLLKRIILSLAEILKTPPHDIPDEHLVHIEKLDEEFWHWKDEHILKTTKYHHHFPPQTIVLYEILCLHDALEELHVLTKQRQTEENSCFKK